MDILNRIATKKARLGVIGLGYVGLPLAVEFARAGFHVVGFDVDQTKVDLLNAGTSYIPDRASGGGRQERHFRGEYQAGIAW
jgi:UDP-N-acetyl-D-glucosamine dehydrogenase